MNPGPEKLEEIVRLAVVELVKQFRGVQAPARQSPGVSRPDLSRYRTPLLSLAMVERVPAGGTVAVPAGTVVSPLAAERIREKNLKVVEEFLREFPDSRPEK